MIAAELVGELLRKAWALITAHPAIAIVILVIVIALLWYGRKR